MKLSVREAREVDVLDRLRNVGVGEREEQALARVLADPAFTDRQVDDVRGDVRRVGGVQVVLERGRWSSH